MKKNYFFAALLVFVFAVNVKAQYDTLQLVDKRPVFHLLFNEFIDDYFKNFGTEEHTFVIHSGDTVTADQGDQIRGHNWSGVGSLKDFTSAEDYITIDGSAEELFLPMIFWDSYLSLNPRPQGTGAYSDANGAYMGPAYSSARTICFFVNVTDSARSGVANGAWDNPFFYAWGNNAEPGQRLHWYFDPSTMAFGFSWGGNIWSNTAEDVIPKNEWVHLGLTIPDDGTVADAKLYINGSATSLADLTADSALTVAINTTPQETWDGIRIGCLVNLWMADYRVYDTELTQADFNALLGISNVSARSLEQKNLFNIYPVPNKGIFTLEFADNGRGEMVVTNMLGQVVHRQLVNNKDVINVGNLPTGIYFISVSDEQNNLQVSKFIIE